MPALVLIAIGSAFIAFGLGYVHLAPEQPPFFFQLVTGLLGVLSVFGGLLDLRFRLRRRLARSGGRERRGHLRLRQPLDDESTTAFVIFATTYGEWLLMMAPGAFRKLEKPGGEPIRAVAIFGEDERIYELQVHGKTVSLQSEGVPLEGRLLAQVEWAEEKLSDVNQHAAKRAQKV